MIRATIRMKILARNWAKSLVIKNALLAKIEEQKEQNQIEDARTVAQRKVAEMLEEANTRTPKVSMSVERMKRRASTANFIEEVKASRTEEREDKDSTQTSMQRIAAKSERARKKNAELRRKSAMFRTTSMV